MKRKAQSQRWNQQIRTAVAVGVALGLIVILTGCGRAPATGQVSFRLAADIRGPANLASIETEISAVSVHSAGRPIEAGWITWQPAMSLVDLAALEPDETIHLGPGSVPAGPYDRVWVVVEAGHAQTATGASVPLVFTIEPIALPFELANGDQIEIVVELIALPRDDGSYELFTKAATLTRDQQPAITDH